MTSDQALVKAEGQYLLYLLEDVSAKRGPAGWEPISGLDRSERDSAYALGRMRESMASRINRLPPCDERDFLGRLLVQCSGEGGEARPPRWPAAALGTVVGMIRLRLFAARSVAA